MSICKGCGREIRWIKTPSGKSMPVDAEAVSFTPAGGPETFVTELGKVVRGRRDSEGYDLGYISHFATCPAAKHFRRRDQE